MTSVAREPYSGSSVLLKILAGGYFNQVKNGLTFGAATLLAVLALSFVAFMCNLVINRPTLLKHEEWNYSDTIPKLRQKMENYILAAPVKNRSPKN